MSSSIAARPYQAQQQREHMTRFFASQGMRVEDVAESVLKLYPEADILLVSSVVQGLAGSTSDIDVIAVDGLSAVGGRAMSDHMIVGKRRIGVTGFPRAEVIAALQELETISAQPLPLLLQALAEREASASIRSGELERVVNGITIDGRMPFGDSLAALALTWRARSFDEARQALACAILSFRASEARAPRAYLLHSVRYMMDAVMSSCGHVYSGEKWFLQRWQRFSSLELSQQPQRFKQLVARVSAAARAVADDQPSSTIEAHVAALLDIVLTAGDAFGYAKWAALAVPTYALSGAHGRLLEGSLIWAASDAGRALQSDERHVASDEVLSLSQCLALDGAAAINILNGFRSKRVGPSLAQKGWPRDTH